MTGGGGGFGATRCVTADTKKLIHFRAIHLYVVCELKNIDNQLGTDSRSRGETPTKRNAFIEMFSREKSFPIAEGTASEDQITFVRR